MAASCPWGLVSQPRQPPFGLEHARRLDIFAQNLANAQRLQEDDLGTAEFGVTQFSDLTGTGLPALGGRQGSRIFPSRYQADLASVPQRDS